MRGLFGGKRGNLLGEEAIFIILYVVFASLIIFYLAWATSGSLSMEQAYAKKIVFFLDNAKPGMTISIDSKDLRDVAVKKNIPLGNVISIDNAKGIVNIHLTTGAGTTEKYFSSYQFSITRDLTKGDNVIIEAS